MFNCYIIRYHEIALKGGNREFFERKLINNIRLCLKQNKLLFKDIRNPRGRIIIYTREDCSILKNVFGISNISKAIELDQDPERMKELALELYSKGSFKISAKRSDKNFPFTSQQINQDVGQYIVDKTGANVNLKKADVDIGIEIVNKKAYVFNEKIEGLNGLPIGTAGKVAVLLEDKRSIVAAYLMMKRGCSINFIKKKDIDVNILEKYSYGSKIKIDDRAPSDVKALVVNDMIGKVRDYDTKLVVLRPLAGFTKEGIKKFLKKIRSRG
ncbi:MAG: hypothetical protein KKA79_04700 [Nanoarchaeota archaeon]|nr:hypothetical protein [Nanoarchaeota archaeon]MCG2717371.1 THUMP domain-containing protein [Nanoarchaeota archaeon]